MQTPSDATAITGDSKLNELLARYPALGPVLVQVGRGYSAEISTPSTPI